MPKTKMRRKQNQSKARTNVVRSKQRSQPSVGSAIVKGLGGIANQFLPGAGAVVGGLGKLFGFGAYTTEQAEAILASRVPTMHATLDRGVRISHHEFLGDVVSSTSFTSIKYPINPGLAVTFPWLSTVAMAFQEWEVLGLIFYFKSTSASALNSTNTALGQIIGATQYNPYQTAPASKIEMLGLSSAADGKPSESNIYPVECKFDMSLFRSKLIRLAAVTDDLAKYDHGNFFLGAAGSQAAAVVGELHIVYDIVLKKPKLWASGSGSAWYSMLTANSYANATPLGSSLYYARSNNLGVTVDYKAQTITIPAANVVSGTYYDIRFYWHGTAATLVYPVISLTNAVMANRLYGMASSSITSPVAGVSSAVASIVSSFLVTASNTDVVISVGTSGTLPSSGDLSEFELYESL